MKEEKRGVEKWRTFKEENERASERPGILRDRGDTGDDARLASRGGSDSIDASVLRPAHSRGSPGTGKRDPSVGASGAPGGPTEDTGKDTEHREL